MQTMNGAEIRQFVAYLSTLGDYDLSSLYLENIAMRRDAALALIECVAHNRGCSFLLNIL